MRRSWIWALGLGGVWTVQAAGPAEWLAEMSQAARTTNYEGVMIYRGGQSLETFRVVHRFKNDEERERVQSLTGEPREILRVGDTVTCLLPRNHRLSSASHPSPQKLFPVLTREQLEVISGVYELRDLGERRIAGRRCQGVAIAPRDRFRYGYEIWADAETRVPIKVSLSDHEGQTLEQMMFTEVRFPASIPDSAFVVDPERAQQMEAVVQERAPPRPVLLARQGGATAVDGAHTPWRPARLPPGFEVVMHVERPLPNAEGHLQHWLVSDGLTAISIFGRVGEAAPGAGEGFSAMGAVNAYRRQLPAFHITVVGEVPRETVRYIADGMASAREAP